MQNNKQGKTKKEEKISNSKGKSAPVTNRKEAHEKRGNKYKDNCDKMENIYGNQIVRKA